ncbi:MAG: hypothetical protein IKS12_00630 [Eubacterium sp.]|nr:hypothetical protein [Eubacterium sp.]
MEGVFEQVCVRLVLHYCFAATPLSIVYSGGFLWDAVCAQHMGFNCIFLMFACYFASALVSYVFRNTFVTGLIASVTAIVVYCLLYWLLFVLMSRPEGAGFALGRFYVPCALYSIALAPVIEAVLIPLKSKVTGERQLDA